MSVAARLGARIHGGSARPLETDCYWPDHTYAAPRAAPRGVMARPLSPTMVADYLIARTGGGLTPLQVIKLTYIGHGYSLALLDEALIEEGVEEWKYGPIVPSVYHATKKYGGRKITELIYSGVPTSDEKGIEGAIGFIERCMSGEQKEVLDGVLAAYGKCTGFELTDRTYMRDPSRWRFLRPRSYGREIPNGFIKSYYKDIVGGGS